MTVICNSSPLIALAQIQQLDLLRRLHDQVLIPPAVVSDVKPTLPILPDWLEIRRPISARQPHVVSASIGAGEHEVISLGLELRAGRVILDERPARRLAAALRLKVIGTVGLLLAAKERGFLTAIKPELERLVL